jgi:glycosyltransferase involved in cell wall biosynthesis
MTTVRSLLTVSGTIAGDLHDEIAAGRRPRADYLQFAAATNADLLDYAEAQRVGGRIGRLVQRIAGNNALLAFVCWRRRGRYDAIVTDGEQVGLPYALLCWFTSRRSRPVHLMIVHIMSVPKKVRLFNLARLRSRIDVMFVYATSQRRFAIDHLRMAPDDVVLTTFMVDTEFFSAAKVQPAPRRMICSAGLEFRDYATLVDAVRDLDVEVVVAAASPWSKRTSEVADGGVPANVTVCKLSLFELRQLYADARFVVMPLHPVEFQAGITTILEAMAMGKGIVCSRTAGQTDAIDDGVSGVYVPPADAVALRAAIEQLLDDEALATRLGEGARAWAVREADISAYIQRIIAEIDRRVADRTA